MADVTFYSQAGADAKFALKADQATVDALPTKTYVDAELGKRATVAYVDQQLGALPTTGGTLVLGPTDEVPAGTAVDTVIVRRTR